MWKGHLQEMRSKVILATMVKRQDSKYKVFWVGNDKSLGGVGIWFTEKWVEILTLRFSFCKLMFHVEHASDCIIFVKLVGKSIATVLPVYAPVRSWW